MIEWTLVTGPTKEPLTIADLKMQARITSDDEQALLDSDIKAARQEAEQYMNRGLYTQTWKLSLGGFAEEIWLPMAAPLQSVTSIKYYDADGNYQTASTSLYTVETNARPGKIVRAPFQVWPIVQSDRMSAVVDITYVVGYANISDIPQRIVQGIRLWASYLYMDREGTGDADKSRAAAEACWQDRVYWKEPDIIYWAETR